MSQNQQIREELVIKARRIVLKLGTRVLLSHYNDINNKMIKTLIHDVSKYKRKGYEFCIVTSGAVGFGMNLLEIEKRPTDLKKIQACASIGQSLLMQKWSELFMETGIRIGQILLTYDIVENRKRFLYARDCLRTLIDYGAIPVVNENDSVAVDELKFGDNDILSTMTANLMDADLLVLFTDTDGVFNKNPKKYEGAERISFINHIDEEIFKSIEDKQDSLSLGGMRSKLQAAQHASKGGTGVIITNGYKFDLNSILMGKDVGTFIRPNKKYIKKRKNWIFLNQKIRGKIFVDAGAENAITKDLRSLLPGGIVGTKHHFKEGSIVGIFNSQNRMIGKGVTYYSSESIEKIKGLRTDNIERCLGEHFYDEVIHRDNMIIL
jgi:glutamate 5-kinase